MHRICSQHSSKTLSSINSIRRSWCELLVCRICPVNVLLDIMCHWAVSDMRTQFKIVNMWHRLSNLMGTTKQRPSNSSHRIRYSFSNASLQFTKFTSLYKTRFARTSDFYLIIKIRKHSNQTFFKKKTFSKWKRWRVISFYLQIPLFSQNCESFCSISLLG